MKVQLEQQQQETFKAEEEKRKAERSLVQVSQNVSQSSHLLAAMW